MRGELMGTRRWWMDRTAGSFRVSFCGNQVRVDFEVDVVVDDDRPFMT